MQESFYLLKIQAIDTRFNPSMYSKVIKLLKPDMVPPVPPVIKEWKADQDKLTVSWIPSSSKDISTHTLKIRSSKDSNWTTIQSFDLADKMQYQFTDLKKGSYDIVIEGMDSSRNIATSRILKVYSVGGVRKPIDLIEASADRTNSKIVLTWKYDELNVAKILIYRAKGDEKVTLYKTIPGERQQFDDQNLSINTKYTYYLKVVFRSGEESPMSNPIEIVY